MAVFISENICKSMINRKKTSLNFLNENRSANYFSKAVNLHKHIYNWQGIVLW